LSKTRRTSPIKRRAALAAGVIAALAIAAPVAGASADTTVSVPLPPYASLPAFLGPLLAAAGPATQIAVAHAGASIGNVFNGGTTVIVSTGLAAGGTNSSP
jgi:hypothetical protein